MCGIIGCIGGGDAVPFIIEGLKKLEYRGYDSAGVAALGEGGFAVVKRKGRLSVLEGALAENPISGNAAIGHTRWATHGEPSDENSHPHVGSGGQIAVVHNGIIENHAKLRRKLIRKGVAFQSETDSEVIAQLADYYYMGEDLLETVAHVLRALEGSYAIGVMCAQRPDVIIAAKKDNPLIVAVSEKGGFIASDVPAVLSSADTVYYMEDGEIAVVTKNGAVFYNSDLEVISKTPEKIEWSAESAEKGGYEHFMLKEIFEQPKVLRDTIESALASGRNLETISGLKADFDKILFIACGSAYNAGVAAKYCFEAVCGVCAQADLASEFRYGDAPVTEKTLAVFISQSGETADTIAALREAKRKGAGTLAIVNALGSTIAKEADSVLYTLAGPEIAVATTKAFTAQLALLYILAVNFAEKRGKITPGEAVALYGEIRRLPDAADELLSAADKVQQAAARFYNCKNVFFIGRGIDYAAALEGSLKLKEISYIHSEAYAGGELKHGPISLIEDTTLVVAVACSEKLFHKTMSNVEQVISRGARVMVIARANAVIPDDAAFLPIPEINGLFSGCAAALPAQMFSYYAASIKGLDIDKPRNLAKSVTVE